MSHDLAHDCITYSVRLWAKRRHHPMGRRRRKGRRMNLRRRLMQQRKQWLRRMKQLRLRRKMRKRGIYSFLLSCFTF